MGTSGARVASALRITVGIGPLGYSLMNTLQFHRLKVVYRVNIQVYENSRFLLSSQAAKSTSHFGQSKMCHCNPQSHSKSTTGLQIFPRGRACQLFDMFWPGEACLFRRLNPVMLRLSTVPQFFHSFQVGSVLEPLPQNLAMNAVNFCAFACPRCWRYSHALKGVLMRGRSVQVRIEEWRLARFRF